MMRTRKRDDDSQHNSSINSDTTSLAALDASSMSATGSRSSLTFASSQKKNSINSNSNSNSNGNGSSQQRQRRPRKRQRKSLTDALQSISLDKDNGVPEQILKMGDFPFSKWGCNNTAISPFGATGILPNSLDLNLTSKQQTSDRRVGPNSQAPNVNGHGDGHGDDDLYYDDDNSQLTSSTVDCDDERERECERGDCDGMEDDDAFDNDYNKYDNDEKGDDDEDEDSQRKKLANMTDTEKAQRKVMLELVFGKNNHREPREVTMGNGTASASASVSASAPFSVREVSSCCPAPPTRIAPANTSTAVPPPTGSFETMFTYLEENTAAPTMNTTAAISIPPSATATAATITATKTQDNEDEDAYKDPADRKIEELLRMSLKNLREGSHPLQIHKPSTNDDLSITTPWKTQDDMTIDPQVYSPRVAAAVATSTSTSTTNPRPFDPNSMSLDSGSNYPTTNSRNSKPQLQFQSQLPPVQARHSVRPRSNSLPGGLEMTDTTAMEMDG